jgi:hypothetical protein
MERSIDVTAQAEVPFDAACTALAADPAAVLGGTPVAGGEHFTLPLGLDLLIGSSLVQEILVDFAPLSADPVLARFGVFWQAIGHPELFPAFGGDLELRGVDDGVEVRLSGYYRAPLGTIGRFGDALIGHRLARRVLETLVQDVAARLESASVAAVEAPEATVLAAELYWG